MSLDVRISRAQAGPVLLYLHWQSGSDLHQKLDIIVAPNGSSVLILTHLVFPVFEFPEWRRLTPSGMQLANRAYLGSIALHSCKWLHKYSLPVYVKSTNTHYLFMSSSHKKRQKSPQSGMHFFISDQHTHKKKYTMLFTVWFLTGHWEITVVLWMHVKEQILQKAHNKDNSGVKQRKCTQQWSKIEKMHTTVV